MKDTKFTPVLKKLYEIIANAFGIAQNAVKNEGYTIYFTDISFDYVDEDDLDVNVKFKFFYNNHEAKTANISLPNNLNPQFIAGLVIGTMYAEDFYQDN